MSRRPAAHDPGFGSDSFLDVLSNLVGILIILVVIAGARVGRAPVLLLIKSLPPAPTESEAEKAEPVPVAPAAETGGPELKPAPEVVATEPLLEGPPKEITSEMQAIAAELASLAAREKSQESAVLSAVGDIESTRAALVAEEQAAAEKNDQLKKARRQIARLEESLGTRKGELTGLLAEFEQVQNAKPAAIEIKHRLAPVSKAVEEKEVHFRLLGNRVTVIPVEALIDRVKSQLERQKEWLARRTRHQGSVGPVDGYSMHYVVERQGLSALEERRLGPGAFRVSVSHWQIVPEPDLEGETVDEALRRGSRFSVALQTAPEKASLTFWVYPDSYALFRKLQAASHAEGFVVSGRPLPEGVSIAGSPNGSQSMGQ